MSSSLQRRLGERIRSLRRERRFTQEAFACRSDIDRATYGKIERGELNVTLLTMARIAVALNVDLATLVGNVELEPDQIRASPRSRRGRRSTRGSRSD